MMFFKRFCFNRFFICYLTVAFSVVSFASSAPAMFIPFPHEGGGTSQREVDLQKIQKLLESKLIQEKLTQLGLGWEEIELRLQQMDDEQIHQIASQINALEAGGSTAEVIIIVILLGLIVFVALELTGVIDVLPW
jgi:hypothetical protein